MLADHAERVTVLERDLLDDTAARPRPGVPQGHHAHGLLARGALIIEDMFPGFRSEVTGLGANGFDFGEGMCLVHRTGIAPMVGTGIFSMSFTRPFLEREIRDRVRRLPQVRILDGWHADGFRSRSGRVTGVTSRSPGDTVAADLVVVATGRHAHLADWLEKAGYPRPRERVIDAQVGYTTRFYEGSDPAVAGWIGLVEAPQPPDLPRGCFAGHVENGLLQVTLVGAAGNHPPHDETAFDAFARSLRGPLYQTLDRSQPLAGVRRYARTANRRLACHRTPRWPAGLIAMGDAVCSFNPIYGQGMTLAALQAVLLGELLTDSARHQNMDMLPRTFQRRLARLSSWPWLLATLPDSQWEEGTTPGPATRIAQRYQTRWTNHIPQDAELHTRFARIMNMLDGPTALLRPAIINAALRGTP
ncbi:MULTISPECIES: monooxygenase [unclassified Streptomyces]|uniref:NAD(P)/FAD-dependent oxidoreductase n=1 Tax=unclassified Streptomyces TaxID=2593676 RepID=UPI00117C40F1|nr:MULTISPECIES: monooxygenase [unclassified Streptomyces]MYT96987.1 monooxygenase [Streptomyces sp. SID8350]